jgi:hypothetical protein
MGFAPYFRVEIKSSYFLLAKPRETLAIKGLQPLESENVPESDKREVITLAIAVLREQYAVGTFMAKIAQPRPDG